MEKNNCLSSQYKGQFDLQSNSGEVTIKPAWHHAGESHSPLPNEVSSNGIVIPHLEPHEGDVRHLNVEDKGLFPHGVKT